MELMTMETLFERANLNWKLMEKNIPYDVSDKNIKIKSFNHETNKNEFRKILNLVRKDDTEIYNLVTKSGDIILKCSGAHRIWDNMNQEYYHVQDVESGIALNKNGENIEFFVQKTKETEPIVDMEVEGNSNYFTNGILSHNTTTGGKALEYYASIRLRIAQTGKIEETIDGEKVVKAIESKITTVKNKCYAPYKSCINVIEFGKGVDNDAGILDLAIAAGFIVKKGGWYSINGSNVAQGMVNLKIYLENNPELYAEIKEKTKEYSANEIKKSEVVNESIDADDMTDEEIANSISASDFTEAGEV